MDSREKHAERTKVEIKQALWRLLQAKPVSQIRVKELAAVSGYSRNTFYRYFRDAYDVLETVETDILEASDRAYFLMPEQYARGQRYPSVENLIRVSEETRQLQEQWLPVLFGKYGDPRFHGRMRARYAVYFQRLFPDWFSDADEETPLLLAFFTAGYIGALDFLGQAGDAASLQSVLMILYRRFNLDPAGIRTPR